MFNTSKQCTICLTDIKKDNKTLECEHNYHKQCIDEWISKSNTCPLCREIIMIPVLNPITNITTLPINNNYSREQIRFINKIKQKIAIVFYSLTVFFFVGSCISHTISIFQTNNYINNIIKNYNETELNGHDSNTYGGEVLIIVDIIFLLMYAACNISILNKSRNMCVYIFYIIICIGNGIIHATFQSNSMNYLNDDVLDIDNKKYRNYCYVTVTMYGSSFATNILILMAVRLYMLEFESIN